MLRFYPDGWLAGWLRRSVPTLKSLKTSSGARPQARAANLSPTRLQTLHTAAVRDSARSCEVQNFYNFMIEARIEQFDIGEINLTMLRFYADGWLAGFAGFAIRRIGELAKKFDTVAILR